MKANINHNAYNSNPKVRDAHQVKLKRDDCRPEMKTIIIILNCCHMLSFYCWYFWRNTNWSLVKVLSLVGIAQTQHLHWGQPDLPLTFAWIQKKIFITLLRGCIAQNWSLQSCQACHVEQCLSKVGKTGQITPEWFPCDKPRLLRCARTSVSCRSQGLSSLIAGSRRRLFVSSPSARPCSTSVFWSWCYLNERVGLASHLWNIKNFPVINRRIVIKSIKRLATRFHVDRGLLWRSVVFLLWFANTTKLHVFVFLSL